MRTRPLAGARFVLLLLALCAPVRARAQAEVGPPPWRVGGRVGFTVDVAAFPDSAGTTLDVYVRIPPGTLTLLARDSLGLGRLRVDARLRGGYGGSAGKGEVQEYRIEPADSTAGMGKVVGLRFPVKPGLHRLSVRVDDVFSRKRGLAYAGRQVTEFARVEGEIRVAPGSAGRELSDPEFVWVAQPGGRSSTFERSGYTVLPNPERLYGLYASQMQVTFTARSAAARPWRWEARVLGADQRVVASRESTAAAAHEIRGLFSVDMATEPAGGYDLELKAWQEGDRAPLVRRARFSVAWRVESWLRNPRDVEDEVHFLLGAAEEEAFALLSPGEQERYLEDYWAVRDPTPGTGQNEARRTYLGRIERANQLYTRPGLGKGMFSDMGRVFIRYGEPSEIVNQVIPTGEESVDGIVRQLGADEDRPVGDIRLKGPGGDPRPFELWIYEGPVAPPPDTDPAAAQRMRRKRLVFLFVDELSTGDFRLRYSTE